MIADILGEIFIKMSHHDQNVCRSVCNKWNQMISTRKYLGINGGFIDMCLNNKYMFFNECNFENIHESYKIDIKHFFPKNPNISVRNQLIINIGLGICSKMNHQKLILMINDKYASKILIQNISSSPNILSGSIYLENYELVIISLKMFKNNYFKIANRSYNILYGNFFNGLFDYGDNSFNESLGVMMQFYDKNILKYLFMVCWVKKFYRVCEHITNKISYNMCDIQMLLIMIKYYHSDIIIRFIENHIKNRLGKKVIYEAIKYDRYYLVKYLLDKNGKLAHNFKLLRMTLRDETKNRKN